MYKVILDRVIEEGNIWNVLLYVCKNRYRVIFHFERCTWIQTRTDLGTSQFQIYLINILLVTWVMCRNLALKICRSNHGVEVPFSRKDTSTLLKQTSTLRDNRRWHQNCLRRWKVMYVFVRNRGIFLRLKTLAWVSVTVPVSQRFSFFDLVSSFLCYCTAFDDSLLAVTILS